LKLGDVLRKERTKQDLAAAAAAERLGMTEDEYRQLEAGESPAEEWGPRLAQIAIELETPTSRLLALSGRAADTAAGQAGPLIRGHRERRGKSVGEMAAALGIGDDDYGAIEAGESPLEAWGPRFLAFAELIEQPVFNLFYPCGLPFQELDDYP
jgi:transcriptional regulator with XRE-family HTH domain